MKNIFNKILFNKTQNICIIVLIVLFASLIIYQIYLAIIHKQNKIYSKFAEGFTTEKYTPQGNITCTSMTSLPTNFYNYIIIDMSNIEIINYNVNGIGKQVDGMINTNNSNSSNPQVNTMSLNSITSPNTITKTSNASDFCYAINTNITNINTLNGNIETIVASIKQLPNGENDLANAVFQSLTSNTSVSPCLPLQNVSISALCQTENTNISNINILNGNTISLNNVVNKMQSASSAQINNQQSTANSISSSMGITNN